MTAEQTAALSVACPRCRAGAGAVCRNYKGHAQAPHGGRVDAARAGAGRLAEEHTRRVQPTLTGGAVVTYPGGKRRPGDQLTLFGADLGTAAATEAAEQALTRWTERATDDSDTDDGRADALRQGPREG